MKKILALFVTILVLGGGSYYFLANKKTADAGAGQAQKDAASKFYAAYQDCMKNPPAEAAGQVSVYCQSHNAFSTSEFVSNLKEGGIAEAGADPIGCAQNPPSNFLVSEASVKDDSTASVVVTEFFGGPRLDILVLLKKIGSDWKVDNVVCPKNPDSIGVTAGWQTYTNENAKVSFKYPQSAGMTGGNPLSEKTTGTGTQVLVQTSGLEFMLIIQPIKPGFPKYYGNSTFVESYPSGPLTWYLLKNTAGPEPYVAYQTSQDNTQYVFVFPNQTQKNQLQETVVSTFQFVTSQGALDTRLEGTPGSNNANE